MAKTLTEHRKAAGLTQTALGTSAGVNPIQINRYEKGKTCPTQATAQKIATVLGVAIADIIFANPGSAKAS